ncbi:hypothetical protein ABDK56_09745 [Sphingomonas sp. ASV193]|uniref:hypothetical protein n=1 Tax=Sphingomonas sp. ASV193 TaxID=3144405 RepID=UPI0032E90784
MSPDKVPRPEIVYVLALPDWKPNEVTPFQGFAPRLPYFIPFLDRLPAYPADILEPTMDPDDRLARRRSGEGSWLWSPVNLSLLLTRRKPLPHVPYMVVMTSDPGSAKAVSRWRSRLRIRPVHLSLHRAPGAIDLFTFTREQLRHRLTAAMRHAQAADRRLDFGVHQWALANWQTEEVRPSSIFYHGHNVTKPNELVLVGAGEAALTGEEGHLNVSSPEEYVRGITESAEAVMALWPKTGDRAAHQITPPRPDLILLAPSMLRGMPKKLERAMTNPMLKSAMRTLDRQRRYTIEIDASDSNVQIIGPLLGLRGAELKLLSSAVGLRAAGTLASTIRLPPAVNRTGGVIGQLARFLRTHEAPPPVKSARVFKAAQQALAEAIPPEHLALIKRSKSGIKIIADAPIEWLPVDGLPLGIRYDVSRIDATPGNLFLEQIRSVPPHYLKPKSFRNYLVLSMFSEGDAIANHLRVGALLATDADREPILGRFGSPRSPKEFVDALEGFDGPMLIVDSHGGHEDGDVAGGLMIGGESFNIWDLAGKVRVPPIVVLSACDTHPFDRSHATVANGFLACGAIAVVATALPIRAPQAARFVMRLINRAVHFAEIVNDAGRSLPWTNVVSGVLRMELATDIIRGFERAGHYEAATGSNLLHDTLFDLNPLRDDWYERLAQRVQRAGKMDRMSWERDVPDHIAASDAIRYLHLGNPESILLSSPQVVRTALKRVTEHEPRREEPDRVGHNRPLSS